MSQIARKLKRDIDDNASISLWEMACETHPLLSNTPDVWFTATRAIMNVIEGLKGAQRKHFRNRLLDILDEKIERDRFDAEYYSRNSRKRDLDGNFHNSPLFYKNMDIGGDQILYFANNIRITKDIFVTQEILSEAQIHAAIGRRLVEVVGPSEYIDPETIILSGEIRDLSKSSALYKRQFPDFKSKTILKLQVPELVEVTYRDLFGDPLKRKI